MNKHISSFQARSALLFTVLFSALAHGYRYLSLSFSGDAMLISQIGEEAYQTSLGRFMQPIYWQIRGYITMPLTIGLFATFFLFLSALLIVRMMNAEKPLHIALICGILTANETMAVSNATYLPWTDVYALALLLCMLGVYVFRHMRYGLWLSPLLYCLSLGLYQSYLPTASTMLILLFLFDVLGGEDVKRIWQRGILSVMTIVAGLLLYALALKVALSLVGVQASQDYNGVSNVGVMSLTEIPALLLGTFLDPLRLLFSLSSKPVMTWHITTVPQLLNIAVFSLGALLLIFRLVSLNAGRILTSLFLLFMLPLSMNFIQFISKGISSGLTIYAYNLAYLLPLALIMHAPKAERPLLRRIRKFSGMGIYMLLALFLALNIRTANVMAFKRDLEFSATTAAMARLLDEAERTEGYIPGETPVVLIGMLPSSMIVMERPGFEEIARAQGMRYTYGASYETGNYWYLEMLLGEPINLVSHTERVRLSKHSEAASLAQYPAKGFCRMIDGYLFVRIN